MRLAFSQRIVAAVAAAAVLASGAAQAVLLGCGPRSGMKSCCCAKGDRDVPQPPRMVPSERACCSVMPAPARHEDATPQATLAQPAPVLVAVPVEPLPSSTVQTSALPPALDHPRAAGPPILRTTCSLLI